MYLDDIVNDAILETDRMECKAKLNRDDVVGWLKTIAGFANANGGVLYIGVEDKTNKLIGFTRHDADVERNFLNNKINEHLTPRPQMTIRFVPYSINEQERFVIEVQINESIIKPVILKYANVPSIYMRRNGFTNGATYEEIIDMSIKSKHVQYDVLDTDIPYSFDDFKLLRDFYKEHNDGKELTDKALKSLGFYNDEGYLSNGAYLFRDDYDEMKTSVQCSLFSGFNKGSERIVTVNKYHGNLIATINYMMEFVMQKMNHSIIKLDTTRENIDAYPSRALFEGIINAVAHRDYYLDGTQIQIDMFKDRLEISSPGSFYKGEIIPKTYDLSNIISKRRNELISNILVRCNVMEAAGTDFDKIMEDYKYADDLHKPYISSYSDHFTLVLPDLTFEEGVRDDSVPELLYIPVPNGTNHDDKIVAYCFRRGHSVAEIAEYLGVSNSSYLRKNVLENLVNNGYLIQSKNGNTTIYKTNRDIVSEQ